MMKKATILILFVLFSVPDVVAEEKPAKQSPQWKAGVASVVITPEQEIWMAGRSNAQGQELVGNSPVIAHASFIFNSYKARLETETPCVNHVECFA